jgi:hypothetical protein
LSQPDEQNDSAQDDLYPLTGDRPAKSKQKSKTSKMSYEKFLCKFFGLDESQSRNELIVCTLPLSSSCTSKHSHDASFNCHLTTMKRHLKSFHEGEIPAIKATFESNGNPVALANSMKFTPLPDESNSPQRTALANRVSRGGFEEFKWNIWRAHRGLPFSVFEECPGAPDCFSTLRSRTTLKTVDSVGTVQAILETKKNELKGVNASVCFDVVKLGNRRALGILLNFVNESFHLKHVLIGLAA